jgi:polyferredoxin
VAPAKNRVLNWVLLGLSFLVAAMFLGVIPLFYFYDPGTVVSFLLWRSDPALAQSLHWIYAVFVLIILVDIAVIRHFWCRFACVYRVWQHSFRTRETLHVRYDASRSSACEKCNYCVTSCFIDIDPRKTDIYDSCINCGECIDACNRLQGKKGLPGLLSFELGERQNKKIERIQFRNNAFGLKSRTVWMTMVLLLGLSFFSWGLWTWKPLHLSAYRAETQASSNVALDYRIEVANKRYQPEVVTLVLKGLDAGSYHFSQTQLVIPPADRRSVTLSVSPTLSHGLHYFIIEASAPDVSWKDHFSIRHFSESSTRRSP